MFIRVIILKTFKFRSSVSFGTHTLLDRSSRLLQLPAHLSRLTASSDSLTDSNVILDYTH